MKSISLSDAAPATAAASLSERATAVLPGVAVFALIFPVALENGGYNPPNWSWATLAIAWLVGLTLLFRERIELSVWELVSIAGLGGLCLWAFASAVWSSDLSASVLGGERTLVYAAAAVAIALICTRTSINAVSWGVLAAATATVAVGLSDVVLPRLDATNGVANTGRLSDPLGYWNAMGLMGIIGLLIALGLLSRSASMGGRWLAAATLPVLTVGTYLTFSRGAWIALAAGFAVAWIADPHRVRLSIVTLVSLPWLLMDVIVTANSPALTHANSQIGPTGSQGHRLAAVALMSMALIAVSVSLSRRITFEWTPSQRTIRGAKIAGLVAALVLLVVIPLALGGYSSTAHRIADALSAKPPAGSNKGTTSSLNGRLFQLSGEGRVQMWTAALDEWETSPVVGQGPLQFAQYWTEHRTTSAQTLEAHSLYLQTLGELGVIGLALLLTALIPPLIMGWRSRSTPMVPIVLGVFVGFLVHNATDWDWSVPGVTLAGLACGMALLASGRGPGRVFALGSVARVAAGAAVVLVIVFAAYSLRVNIAIAASTSDAGSQSWGSAESQAQVATSWAPWLEDGWVALGQARLGGGDSSGAASAFRRALTTNPQDWTAWYGLARATTGSESDAALQHALAINPHEPTLRTVARQRAAAKRIAAAKKRRQQLQAQKQASNSSSS